MNIGGVGTQPSGSKARQGGSREQAPTIPRCPQGGGDGGLGTVPVPILLSHCRVLTGGSSGYHPPPAPYDNPAPASSHPLDLVSILMSPYGKPQREVAQEVPKCWRLGAPGKQGQVCKLVFVCHRLASWG